jgi:hypothetical protein
LAVGFVSGGFFLFLNPLRLRLSGARFARTAVEATSPFLMRFAQKGEAGHGPSGWSPGEMPGSCQCTRTICHSRESGIQLWMPLATVVLILD